MPAQNRAKALQRYVQYSEIKYLLDRLIQIQEKDRFVSMAILSESDGEGKTFVCAALGTAYAERLHKKVLIVDTTSPRPMSTPAPAKGRSKTDLLTELLEESDNVDVISLRDWSGLKTGGEADEYQLKALLAQNATQYSLVLVDTSSLSRRNRHNFDPALTARQCDVSVIVSGRTELGTDISEEHKRRITGSGIRLIGMIHNQGEAPQQPESQGSITHGKQ